MLNCNVKKYGAVGDGVTMDTAAIQAAIDECAAHGGGQVILQEGSFLCGFIQMKSGVELHIERDAVLLGSTNPADFPQVESDLWLPQYSPRYNSASFIYGDHCEDIAITGRGKIDCQGQAFVEPFDWYAELQKNLKKPGDKTTNTLEADHLGYLWNYNRHTDAVPPPRVVFFIGCKNVLVEDVTMQNQPAGWGYWITDCENVHFHRAQIIADVDFPNNDGIHINCCRNVTISDCNVTCGDDAVVVRAYSLPMGRDIPCEKVTVTNCNFTTHASGVRVGWIGDGTIRNCTFSNLNITESNMGINVQLPGGGEVRKTDEGTEKAHFENLSFSNITMDKVYFQPIRIFVDNCNNMDVIRNLYFDNIHAFCGQLPEVTGREDIHVQNIYFTNCHFIQVPYARMGTRFSDFMAEKNLYQPAPIFQHVDNLVLNNTVFSVL